MPMGQRDSSMQHHRRWLSAVHLDGLSVLGHTQDGVRGSDGKINRNVWTFVKTSPTVLLWTGSPIPAGNMTLIIIILTWLPTRTSISLLDVETVHQVRNAVIRTVYFPGFWICVCQWSLKRSQHLLKTFISIQIYMKWSNIYVHHFNYCQWRISREGGKLGLYFSS